MPVTKSAAKRVRQEIKRHRRNLRLKRAVHSETKALLAALATNDTKTVTEKHVSAQKALDKAAKNNVIHPNKAARKKSQLAKAIAGSKPKAPAKKTATKPAKETDSEPS